ncbi:S-adenosyl-L-methionine-dependent methyltransferase [Protomyces lactucae-debilis]|uniref:tRNA N(3)-methylcytidine methyltransferase n=1 Tax=Protomyces lactucae-debilis TaxID=2754530 RepID=A0A1Y2ETD6_PROLT|nr:S-adenosyl-L-methionine-dependent methyltransferase [Protomyces lactucae-debilis]ORY74807.1 S-adenosyl-L-methionine-dependent methyltransferase [Protomyces lactucae-debilis]
MLGTFGTRLLTDASKVLEHNAWDHVEWDEAHLAHAEAQVAFQQAHPVSDPLLYNDDKAASHWDTFYKQHDEQFFKDRKWIQLEFPELIACTEADAGPLVIADIGCAVGNTLFPLLRINENPQLRIHALDFSAEAIEIVKRHPEMTAQVDACVWDMADPAGLPSTIQPGSVDVCVLIFSFSALSPKQWPICLKNLQLLLKPGGTVLLRDYGRYDLTQLRIKRERLLEDHFYIRGDGTRVYYFTTDEMQQLFSEASGFSIFQNTVDRRLLVNRKENKKMYRAWVQLKATRLEDPKP